MSDSTPLLVVNPWAELRQFTAARIALGRTGVSLPTEAQLAFQLAHAQARDAVHRPLDVPQLLQDIHAAGLADLAQGAQPLVLSSAAPDRHSYLQRPDWGRRLSEAARWQLGERTGLAAGSSANTGYGLAFVIADGLSAPAINRHAPPLLAHITRLLANDGFDTAPLAIVTMARVAVGDEIAALLKAQLVVVLIGERPGLSSPDSLGLYITWAPRVGLRDDSRNCISNVRPEGLSYAAAATKVRYLLLQMRQRQLSGVGLKDESTEQSGVQIHPAASPTLLNK